VRVESYSVKCPECHGLRYVGTNLLCPVCNGVGQIVIPDARPKRGISRENLRNIGVILVMLAAGVAVWMVW
jgi:hypothetical protein